MTVFYDQLALMWIHISMNLALQVLLVSTVCLFAGVGLQVWLKVIRTGRKRDALTLESHGLKKPAKETLRVILTTFLCAVSLLVAALQGLQGVPPFTGPYDFVYLLGLFAIVAAMSALLEIKSLRQAEYAYAFLVSTALAFLFLGFKFNIRSGSLLQTIALLWVLIACGILAKRVFFPQWLEASRVVFLVTFVGWLLIYMLPA